MSVADELARLDGNLPFEDTEASVAFRALLSEIEEILDNYLLPPTTHERLAAMVGWERPKR